MGAPMRDLRAELIAALQSIRDMEAGFKRYNPDQPRDPKGSETGGQWASSNASTPITNPVQLSDNERDVTNIEILDPETPSLKARSRNVEDIAKELDERAHKALKALGIRSGRIEEPGKHDELISRLIASEVQAAIHRSGDKGSHDWYSAKVEKAISIASEIHPEIIKDQNARMGFTAALAITSQGETVPSNVRLAEEAYRTFKDTGRFPTSVVSKHGPSMAKNFAKLNAIIDERGVDGAREFLASEFTKRDLEKAGFKIANAKMDSKVYGSAIFGQKIGQGFYQNLNGNFKPVTFDLWFMRGWNRLTGNLVGMDAETLAKQRTRMEEALREAGMNVPKTNPGLDKVARDIVARHEIDFSKNRHLYDTGEKKKSTLTLSAERFLVGRAGINEQPSSAGQREWMKERVYRAVEILRDHGIDTTPADLQAAWWYPEKELYGKLGGRDSEGVNVDYASAYRKLIDKRRAANA